jgi:hypothetical protein
MSVASLAMKLDIPSVRSQVTEGIDPSVLASIYDEDLNIAVWQRTLAPNLKQAVASFVEANPTFKASMTVTANDVLPSLIDDLGKTEAITPLVEDIARLVEMFCCLFELKRVGLRLTVLSHAMCPRFHVDRIPCRLVTTYQGSATQWLTNAAADRSMLGHANGGRPDHESGLYSHSDNVQQLKAGDMSLLKGELWEGNEGAGLIHRSPSTDLSRLLLTLDFSF